MTKVNIQFDGEPDSDDIGHVINALVNRRAHPLIKVDDGTSFIQVNTAPLKDEKNKKIREKIQNTLSDLIGNFFYYDRKEDPDLPVGAIEQAVKEGVVTTDELIEWVTAAIRVNLRQSEGDDDNNETAG